MMLNLLSTTDAAFIVYYLSKKQDWQLAFNPRNQQEIRNNEKEHNQLLVCEAFIKNAILADELPAKKIPRGKTADKKVFEKFDIPAELHNALQQYDYWITQEDLWIFIERPSVISKDYAHGRDALARLLCALVDSDKLNEKDLFNYLADIVINAEATINPKFKLGDNTLKNCCREILETFTTIKNSDAEK
jgi:hypothetical protein